MMEHIRVRVEILPWSNRTELLRDEVKPRQDAFRPYLEPCTQDVTINELAERIGNRFEKLQRRTLDIRCLTDYWGDVLDTSDENEYALKVGHVFKETANIFDRTLKVVQSPPDPNELRNPQRYESIPPNSSARPRKRLLGQSLPGPRSSLRNLGYDAVWESEPFDSSDRPHKRQKIQTRSFEESDPDRPIRSREDFEDNLYISSQSSARRSSPVHQVDDSQRSPKNKQPNPYGTPTSLTVHSPLKLATTKHQLFSIPDSPPSRATSFHNESAYRADDLDLRNTKSESPELTSVLELPFDDTDAITERESGQKISASDEKVATPASLLHLKDQQVLETEPVDSRVHPSATVLAVSDKLAKEKPGQFAKPNLPFSRTPRAKAPCRNANGVRAQSLDIFDPIDTDVESSQELHHIRSAKRSRFDNFPSRGSSSLLPSIGKVQDLGKISFVVPPFSKATSNAAISLTSDENNPNDPRSSAEIQLQAEVPMSVKPFLEQQVSPKATRQVPRCGVGQAVDDLLPWEIQGKDRLVGGAVPYVAKQQEHKTVKRDPSTEAIRRERTPVDIETERRAEEAKANEEKAVQELADKEAVFVVEQARKARLASEEVAKKKLAKNEEAKAELAWEEKANEEEENRKRIADQKDKAEKDLAEKLAQDLKAKEEKAAKRNARRREVYAEKASNANIANGKERKQPKQADSAKACEEKKARVNSESLIKVNAKGAELSLKVSTGAERKSTPPSFEVKPDKTPKLVEFPHARLRQSSTPSSMRSDPDRARTSMTPAVPSSTNKLFGSGTSLVTARLSAQPPLRSALRQNSIVSKRSVSFMDGPADPAKLDSSPSTAAALKLNGAKNTQSSTEATKDGAKSRGSSTSGSSESVSGGTSKQPKDLPNKATPKDKVQTKLNIKRDKKMKGRMIDPPLKLPSPALLENIVISSDSEVANLSVSEDEGDRPRNAKAGPSSKKKLMKAEFGVRAKAFPTSATPADKIWESITQDIETPSRKLVPKVVVERPITRSRSRSPAQYMSGLHSASSGSGSESGSESGSQSGTESGSESDSDDKLDTLPLMEPKKGEVKLLHSERVDSRDIEMEDAASVQISNSELASKSSRTSSVEARKPDRSSNDDSRRLAQDASQQLQRECHESLVCSSLDTSSKTSDPPVVKGKPPSSVKNPRDLDHPVRHRGKSSKHSKQGSSDAICSAVKKSVVGANSLPGNVPRPSNQRYPSLAVLMETPKVAAKPRGLGIKAAESQGKTTSVADDSLSSSSESESESESSGGENGDVTANDKTQNSATSKKKGVRRLDGVLKLARISRARGSQQR